MVYSCSKNQGKVPKHTVILHCFLLLVKRQEITSIVAKKVPAKLPFKKYRNDAI